MHADFSFNEEQLELQRSARRLCAEADPFERARADEESESGFDVSLWRRMGELGWLGLALPASVGGGGGRFLDGYALSEELGRGLVTSPFVDSLGVAAPILASQGARFEGPLARVTSGQSTVSVAVGDRLGRLDRSDVSATREANGWRLSGAIPLAAFASTAEAIVVSAESATGGGRGLSLFLIPAQTAGLALERVENIGALPLYRVELSDVVTDDGALLGSVGAGWDALYPAVTTAAVLQTAYIVGAAHRVLELTNQYAKDRWQFGIPIGKNQAVQYMVSDVLIDLHTTDLLGRQAAYLIDAGRRFEAAAEMAIVHGKSQAAHLHRQAHEVFAGIAFIREHPLNLFSRKSKYWENHLGDVRFHYDQVARIVCDDHTLIAAP